MLFENATGAATMKVVGTHHRNLLNDIRSERRTSKRFPRKTRHPGNNNDNDINTEETKMEEISIDSGRAMAKVLNVRFELLVYAMARRAVIPQKIPSGSKITMAKAKLVTNQGCEISLVICRGDLCEMNTCFYTFSTPLQSANELFDTTTTTTPQRIPLLYNEVCSPRVMEILTGTLYLPIVVIVLGLGYAHHVLGHVGMDEVLETMPTVENIILMCFGSIHSFGLVVAAAWYFANCAHLGEATVAAYFCRYVLRLNSTTTLKWFLWGFTGGYVALYQLVDYLKVQWEVDTHKINNSKKVE
jgi:hypothetical protein